VDDKSVVEGVEEANLNEGCVLGLLRGVAFGWFDDFGEC
jgi:hypothetical protein